MTQSEQVALLERRRINLTERIKDIDAELGQRGRFAGRRRNMTESEYEEWRKRAIWTKRNAEKNLIRLNAELKAVRASRHALTCAPGALDSDNPDSLIAHAHKLLRRLASEGVDIDPDEQVVIDALQAYLHHGALKK